MLSGGCSRACRCPGFSRIPQWLAAQQRAGRPAVRFGDIPLEWTDFRLSLRQTADILRRYEALDRDEHSQILALGRDGNALQPLVAHWYAATSGVGAMSTDRPRATPERRRTWITSWCSRSGRFWPAVPKSLMQRVDLSGLAARPLSVLRLGAGLRGHHPERRSTPDLRPLPGAVGVRPLTCPFCANDDRALVTSFATRDGRYRVYACDVCRRYLKAYDGRRASRPVHGGGGRDRDAAARRGGHAAGLCRVEDAKSTMYDLVIFDLLAIDDLAIVGFELKSPNRKSKIVDLLLCLRRPAGVLVAKITAALDESQLNRFSVSRKRPAFERAPSTTTATC